MRGITVDGAEILRQRKRLGWTQEELAARAHVDVKTIRHAELSRNVDPSTLTRIAGALDVDAGALQGDGGDLETFRRRQVDRWLDAYQQRDVHEMLAVYHDDAVVICPSEPRRKIVGKDQFREQLVQWMDRFEAEPMDSSNPRILHDDRFVLVRARWSLTHIVTGNRFESESLIEFEFRGGKVARQTTLLDTAGLFRTTSGGKEGNS